MKKLYTNILSLLLLAGSATSCGDSFLESKLYSGVDTEKALTSVSNVENALNGTYYRLFQYYFAGNYATSLGDIASDLTYHNGKTSHWTSIYRFSPQPTDIYLGYIWEYGYKVIDNSSRIIEAEEAVAATASEYEIEDLYLAVAESYALRAYAQSVLVNVFGHQVKVAGEDYSSAPGIVIVKTPVAPESTVQRATVGECYDAILSDINNALKYFELAGGDRGDLFYMSEAATYGLKSRVCLALEQWQDAADAADAAIELSGITELAYTPAAYHALYNGGASNVESIFALAITPTNNWSANSCGTLWSSYSYSPNEYLQGLYADTDVRTSIMGWGAKSTPTVPIYAAGKFAAYAYGNPAFGTNYLINAPEMYLNAAEALAQLGNTDDAKASLLVVAKRNTAITTTNDLPGTKSELLAFIKDERARELFQEGFRLYDLRRWKETSNFAPSGSPNNIYGVKDFCPSDVVFPIPADEVNAGFGVEQTPDWSAGFPKGNN